MVRVIVVGAPGAGPESLPGAELVRAREVDAGELSRADAVLFVWPLETDFEMEVYRVRALQGTVALLLWAHTEDLGDLAVIARCELDGYIDARWPEELAVEAIGIAVRQVRWPNVLAGAAVPRGGDVSLYDLAVTDALTGLYNRRVLEEALGREQARARRYKSRYALLLADVDGLKAINRQHGRDAGDEVLRRVSKTLVSHVRECDGVFRFSKDELAVLLPYARPHDAAELAHRLGEAVALEPIETASAPILVSLSFGIACYPEAERVVEAATRALAAAQAKGTGRVAGA